MREERKKREKGSVEVEAAILMPITILSVLLLLYLALFLFQRAHLQASLETALIYYKNTVTDTYISRDDRITYTEDGGSYMGSGNSYSATEPLSPYRGMIGDGNNLNSLEDFEEYFYSAAGGMALDENLSFTVDYRNYVYLKQLEVTATQKVKAPIDFSALGIGREYKISAAARVAVLDHDGVVRDADYAVSLVKKTKLGEIAGNLASKVAEAYEKMKNLLGA